MTATISERNGRVLVNLLGDIDLEHSGDIRQVLLDCVGRGADVLVDIRGIHDVFLSVAQARHACPFLA